jgi:hypothetical protein
MSDFDFDVASVGEFEDVKLEDASKYQDQTDSAPLQPGNYRLRVDEAGERKDSDGEPIKDNGYPVISVNKLTIIEPEELAGREIFPFQNYSLRPVQSGNRKGSIPAVDLLRGFDDTLTFASAQELVSLLAEQITNGNTLVARTSWIAKDSEAIKEAIEAAGGDLNDMDEDERKELFKTTIFRGQKRFPKVNGFFVPEVIGPSGDTLTARVNLQRIFPSSKEVKKMGATKRQEKAA